MKNKCIAVKKNSQNCNNYAMRNTDYCYIHSLKKKGISSSLNNHLAQAVIGVIFLIISLSFAYFLYSQGPSKANQNKIISSQELSNESLNSLMKNYNESRQYELLREYPVGYTIFAINSKNTVLPNGDDTLKNYEIDWSKVGLRKTTTNEIAVQLPDIRLKSGNGGISNIVVGGPKKVGNLSGAFTEGLTVLGEIIDISDDGIVFLVGFQKNHFKEMDIARVISEEAIDRIHNLFNEGKYEKIWEDTSSLFRARTEKNTFDNHMQSIKSDLGEFQLTTNDKRTGESIQDSSVIVDVKQRSIFTKKETVEGFTFEVIDKKAFLVGWHVNINF